MIVAGLGVGVVDQEERVEVPAGEALGEQPRRRRRGDRQSSYGRPRSRWKYIARSTNTGWSAVTLAAKLEPAKFAVRGSVFTYTVSRSSGSSAIGIACENPSSRCSVSVAVDGRGLRIGQEDERVEEPVRGALGQVPGRGRALPRASALWPPRFSCQYIVRSTTIGTAVGRCRQRRRRRLRRSSSLTRIRLRLVAANGVGQCDRRAAGLLKELNPSPSRPARRDSQSECLLRRRARSSPRRDTSGSAVSARRPRSGTRGAQPPGRPRRLGDDEHHAVSILWNTMTSTQGGSRAGKLVNDIGSPRNGQPGTGAE